AGAAAGGRREGGRPPRRVPPAPFEQGARRIPGGVAAAHGDHRRPPGLMADVEELLAASSAGVRPIVERLRSLVAETLPDVTETVDLPDRLLGYGTGPRLRDAVLAIIPHGAHVNVQLPDADE